MNDSSRPKFLSDPDERSTETSSEDWQGIQQIPLALDRAKVTPGSTNDGHLIRLILADSMRRCGKSRAQIADEMTFLMGTEVTERRLNGFVADSREDLRWPAELDRAFAIATGDDRILRCRAEAAGLKVISGPDIHLLELGRQFLQRERSDAEIVELKRRLKESGL